MAFLGVLASVGLTIAAAAVIIGGMVFLLSILPIIIGAVLLHATKRKRFAVGIRIFGYIAFIPSAALGIFLFVKIIKMFALFS